MNKEEQLQEVDRLINEANSDIMKNFWLSKKEEILLNN